MDPISQAALGALAAQSGVNDRFQGTLKSKAWWVGALAGMAPDLDNLISTPSAVLAFNEYHRHFTHSFAFIPIGSLIVTGFLCLFPNYRAQWKTVFLACLLGYASHGLLDAFTTYGTLLYWPFNQIRVSWDLLAIIDPFLTIPLILFAWIAAVKRSLNWARVGLGFLVLYIGFSWMNRHSAETTHEALMMHRHHFSERKRITPLPGSPVVWRAFYETEGKQVSDIIRSAPWLSENQVILAGSAPTFDRKNLPFKLDDPKLFESRLKRFQWFTKGWMIQLPEDPNFIGDGRYTMSFESPEPMWGLRVDPSGMTQWESKQRRAPNAIANLWDAIQGNHPQFQNLSQIIGPSPSKLPTSKKQGS